MSLETSLIKYAILNPEKALGADLNLYVSDEAYLPVGVFLTVLIKGILPTYHLNYVQ